jgi:hypothetical protein
LSSAGNLSTRNLSDSDQRLVSRKHYASRDEHDDHPGYWLFVGKTIRDVSLAPDNPLVNITNWNPLYWHRSLPCHNNPEKSADETAFGWFFGRYFSSFGFGVQSWHASISERLWLFRRTFIPVPVGAIGGAPNIHAGFVLYRSFGGNFSGNFTIVRGVELDIVGGRKAQTSGQLVPSGLSDETA